MAETHNKLAIIGGTGLTKMNQLEEVSSLVVDTPYGKPSSQLATYALNSKQFTFLARHGDPHAIPPHLVNYRANIAALKAEGVRQILAVNAVGSIDPNLSSRDIVVPDQIIDYTWGRTPTFFDGHLMPLEHIDFSYPFDDGLRQNILNAAEKAQVQVVNTGTYGVTQGPRLETAAEIRRMGQDGCTLVGMTMMPEAVLAREMGLEYASLCLVVNPAAGVSDGVITMDEIYQAIEDGMASVQTILRSFIAAHL